jgi:hypothetical protein
VLSEALLYTDRIDEGGARDTGGEKLEKASTALDPLGPGAKDMRWLELEAAEERVCMIGPRDDG